MTTYDYQIYYDNGTMTELGGCLERIDLDALTQQPFFTLNLPASETRKVGQRILVNMAHVTNINEFVQELDPANADDIRRALVLAHDDRARAARLLGISEQTLYRKMKENEIEGKEVNNESTISGIDRQMV
jgi:transcriptional regulator with PAS, ATPase and Fis domain